MQTVSNTIGDVLSAVSDVPIQAVKVVSAPFRASTYTNIVDTACVSPRKLKTSFQLSPEATAGAWLGTKHSDGTGPFALTYSVFCYGGEGITEIRVDCKNPSLTARPAVMPDAVRVFAGKSRKLMGAAASIIPRLGEEVQGWVVELSLEELTMLDAVFCASAEAPYSPAIGAEYRRQDIAVLCNGVVTPVVTYVANDLTWKGPPTESYLTACRRNVGEFWLCEPEVVIDIRDGSGQRLSS